MKLLNYTNSKLTILILFLISLWGIFFYYAIHHEIMDETDDMLESYRDIFVKKALNDPSLLDSSFESAFDRYAIRMISDDEAEKYIESWTDSEVYFPLDNEHIPMRVFKSIFLAPDNNFYELEISMSTLERDDMIETLLVFLLSLYLLLLLCIIIGNRIILKKSFRPLDRLLSWINSIVPGKPIPLLNNETPILEFRELNQATLAMSERNLQAYEQQKVFIENASHELQTPLAIALNKVELLSQSEKITEQQLAEIDEIFRTLNRAIKLNKSLLLLSRIDNKQFKTTSAVNFNTLINQLMRDFNEIYSDKNIQSHIDEKSKCTVSMNETLSDILITNLLKNAFTYTPPNGSLLVTIGADKLIFTNSGDKTLDKDKIFQRFYHCSGTSNSDSNGLGLSIVKSICALYDIDIEYTYNTKHIFQLKFPKKLIS